MSNNVVRLDAAIQYTNKSASDFDDFDGILPLNLLVYDPITKIIKKGNGNDSYVNLPEWLNLNELEDIAEISQYLDSSLFDINNIGKIVILDNDGKFKTNVLDNTQLQLLIDNIAVLADTYGSSTIASPFISAVNTSDINNDVLLTADTISGYDDGDQFYYEWLLPGGTTEIGSSLLYNIPDDNGLYGDSFLIKCRGISTTFGTKSAYSEHVIIVSAQDAPIITGIDFGFAPTTTTPAPFIQIDELVREGETIVGSILNHEPGETYEFIVNLGTIVWVSGNTFEYTAPMNGTPSAIPDNINVIGTRVGKLPSESIDVEVLVINIVITPNPIVVLDSVIGENDTINGSISNYVAGTDYDVIVNFGSMSIIDGTGAFTYTAPNVDENVDDVISITATFETDDPSDTITHDITILNTSANTPTPTLNIASNVTEEIIAQGVITNHVTGETYQISAIHGSITNVSGGTFNYTPYAVTVNTPDTISIIGTAPGKDPSLQSDTNITINNRVTTTPVLSIANNILEETIEQGVITNYIAGTTYTITASIGTISNAIDGTFDYTAPAVTEDTPDTISIIAYVTGDEDSIQLDTVITIDNTGINPFAGYPCEFSHFSKYHQNNILKITTTTSNLTQWDTLTDHIPVEITSAQSVVCGNYAYLLGGYDGTDARSEIYKSDIVEGNLSTFQPYGNLPIALSNHQAIIIGTKLYIFGGVDSNTSLSSKVWYSEIAANGDLGSWIAVTDLPIELMYHQVVITKNRIYILGGYDINYVSLPNVYYAAIDANDNLGTWVLDSHSLPTITNPIKTVRTKSRIYLIGDADNLIYSEIDPDGILGAWTVIPAAIPSVVLPNIVMTGNRVFIIGSYVTRNIYYADIDNNGHIGSFATITTALNHTPSGVGIVVTSNQIYLIGGDSWKHTQRCNIANLFDGWSSSQLTSKCNDMGGIPTLSIAVNITESTTTQGTITNHVAGTTYTITATLGTISNISNDTFDYTAPESATDTVSTIRIIAHVIGEDDSQSDTNITIDNRITPTPVLSIAANILEETTEQGTITNYIAGTTYTITAFGDISNIVDDTFDYTAPTVGSDYLDTISIIAHVTGDEDSIQLDHGITIDNRVTPTPILSIVSNVTEETTTQGTITNYIAGTTYTISATLGTISNAVDGTFDYTASEVTENTPDVISIIAHVTDDEDSLQLDHGIIIDNTSTYPFAGYPCEFSHFSEYEKQNILKTTTSDTMTGWTSVGGAIISNNESQIVVTSSRIYSIGGDDSNTMRYADIDAAGNIGTWYTDAITLPTNLSGTCAIIIKNRVYLLGGHVASYNATNKTYYADIDSNGHIGNWLAGGDLAYTTTLAQVVITKNKIFLINGHTAGTDIMKADIDSNGHLGTWATYALSSVNHGVFNSAIVRTKSRLYLMGGFDSDARNYVQYTEIDSNGDIGSWTDDTGLPGNRYGHSVITTKNKVYLLGGSDGSGPYGVNSIHSADIDSNGHIGSWVAGGSLPTDMWCCPYAITESKIYGFPSSSTNVIEASFDGWDPRMDDATTVNYAPTPVLSIANNILEETTEQGTITNYVAGTTYTISAVEGTISNISNDTFDYIAPAVTTDTPDTISIIAHVTGDEDSIELNTGITIINS